MILRLLVPVLFAAVSWAQTAPAEPSGQPPADVDHALRVRVAQFYNLIVKHEYRRAEELVAPDSRDFYYEREKPRYLSFEIAAIKWSENFTHAEVVITAKVPPTLPMSIAPLDQSVTGIWQLLDGAWYWAPLKVTVTDLLKNMYGVPKDDSGAGGVYRLGQGGDSTQSDAKGGSPAGPALPSNANLPGGMGRPDAMSLGATAIAHGRLQLDPPGVTMAAASSEKVTITNGGQAVMTLFLLGKLDDLEATIEPASIKPGDKAVLTLKAGPHPRGGSLLIGVNETKEMLSLPIAIK